MAAFRTKTQRLLRNPDDFAAVLEPLYGSVIAARFAALLRDHHTIAAELVKALQAGNSAASADAQKRWFMNADAIAEFLGQINPYWSTAEWKRMLHENGRRDDERNRPTNSPRFLRYNGLVSAICE